MQKSKKPFDVVITFGEGPIKPVLLEEELNEKEKKKWLLYKSNPIKQPEPNFFCLKQHSYLSNLKKIKGLQAKEMLRQQWQWNGGFALRQWGTQNALAAGYSLYKGATKKVVLTGGKTITSETKRRLPKKRVENWPSEAWLMKDVIKRYYGGLYEKKYGRSIDKAIIIEDASTNTLENFAYTINTFPEILSKNIRVGFISADHHLKRITKLAELFSVPLSFKCQQSARQLLVEAGINISSQKSDLRLKQKEKQWITGLSEPRYLTYWLGFIGLVKSPFLIQRVINKLKEDEWLKAAEETFEKLSLSFNEIKNEDFTKLAYYNSTKYNIFLEKLTKLRSPQYRILPPDMI